jgi:hypothetical protein
MTNQFYIRKLAFLHFQNSPEERLARINAKLLHEFR